MKLYENRNQKSHFTCGYCHENGHRINHCPTLKAHYDQDQRGESIDMSLMKRLIQWYGANSPHLETWYEKFGKTKAEKYFGETQKTKATKPRKKPKCGFCGKTTHNRRNCKSMTKFKYLYEQANKAYRQEFYDRFIKDMGLGAGALVSLRQYDRSQNDYVSKVALMTELDPKSISLTNLQNAWSDYRTNLRMGFLLDGQKIVVGDKNHSPKLFHFDVSRNERDYVGLEHGVHEPHGYWDNGLITEIVSPAPNIMSQEWFDGEFEPIEWVMKKRNGRDLWSYLGSYIKSFYPHADKDKKINAFKKSIGLPC